MADPGRGQISGSLYKTWSVVLHLSKLFPQYLLVANSTNVCTMHIHMVSICMVPCTVIKKGGRGWATLQQKDKASVVSIKPQGDVQIQPNSCGNSGGVINVASGRVTSPRLVLYNIPSTSSSCIILCPHTHTHARTHNSLSPAPSV